MKRDSTIYVAKTKALIRFVVTVKLICVFVFAYVKRLFSHDAAHIITLGLDGYRSILTLDGSKVRRVYDVARER